MNKLSAIIILLGILISPTAHANTYALLVGVGKHKLKGIPPLKGIERDVEKVRSLLTNHFRFKNIKILLNQKATKKNIYTHLRMIAKKAGPKDTVFFYFSGYGSRIPDTEGDEKDTFDETLVPYDIGKSRSSHITDDDIHQWLKSLRAKHTTILLDAGHNGGQHKGIGIKYYAAPSSPNQHFEKNTGGFLNFLTPNKRPTTQKTKGAKGIRCCRDFPHYFLGLSSNILHKTKKSQPAHKGPKFVLLSPSQMYQYAYFNPSRYQSVFTHFLVRALTQHNNLSVHSLIKLTEKNINRYWPMQPFAIGQVHKDILGRKLPTKKPELATRYKCKDGLCAHFQLLTMKYHVATPTFRNKEELRLTFKTNKDAYVAVLTVDHKGKINQIFPKMYYKILRILSKKRYTKRIQQVKKRGGRHFSAKQHMYMLPADRDLREVGIRVRVEDKDFKHHKTLHESFVLLASKKIEELQKALNNQKARVLRIELRYSIHPHKRKNK